MFRAVLGIFVVLSLATTAHAQPGNTPPPPAAYVPPPPPVAPVTATRTERYTMSIVGVDALAGGLMMFGVIVAVSGGLGGDEESFDLGIGLMIAGVGTYAFGPAFVHSRHNNNSSAWKSVALRLGLPMLGGLIGGLMDKNDTNDPNCVESCGGSDVAGSLGGLGVLGAMVIDWAVLAKVDVPVTTQPYYPYPYAAPATGGGTTFGLAGAF